MQLSISINNLFRGVWMDYYLFIVITHTRPISTTVIGSFGSMASTTQNMSGRPY